MNKKEIRRLQELLNREDTTKIIESLPDHTYIEEPGFIRGKLLLSFQASSQDELQGIKSRIARAFPQLVWKRAWNKSTEWWEYSAENENFRFEIYAVRESPPQCSPIYDDVEEKVPVEYETKKVRKIVGWDCGNNNQSKEKNHDEN